MNDVNSLAHSSWNCKYHVVFAPKYRRKVFFGEKRREIGSILRTLCNWKGIKIIEAEVCADHIHMLIEIPPKIAVASFIMQIPEPGILVPWVLCGHGRENAKKIQKYIQCQYEQDKAGEQLTMPNF